MQAKPRFLLGLCLVITLGLGALMPVLATVVPYPGMVITTNTTFTPGTYNFGSGQGITIAASNITVDGNGAVLDGPGTSGNPSSFVGTAVTSDGYNGVTLKNLTAYGFLLGLYVKNATGWTITGNNFSNNYTNPDYGWGDDHVIHDGYAPAGAICLNHVTYSAIAGNTGDNVWDGLYLYYSDHNTVNGNNHFSPCSNVCLKMWHSSYNLVDGNVMSYGIRCDPEETHARDSTSAMLETGSDYNQIKNNDFSHGGDGVFIRTLNSWVSKGNYFYNNDVSYAHNNGFESWCPDNTFEHNTANYCSYGFWLGGSDHTVLIDNTAAYNGTVNANAPEDFGNAGVAVVGGSSSHFICERNNIHDNGDGSHPASGLAIRYQADYQAFHWIIQKNTITNNSKYGLYYKDTKWADLAANTITGNTVANIYDGGNVTNVFNRTASMSDLVPNASATISATTVYIGTSVLFNASGSSDPNDPPLSLSYRWDLGDGTVENVAQVTHAYTTAGFKRVGLTVNNGKLADLTWFDVYVVDNHAEVIGTEDSAANWSYWLEIPSDQLTLSDETATENRIQGTKSLKLETNTGMGAWWYYPAAKNAHWNLSAKNVLRFWMKSLNQNNGGFQEYSPTVHLHTDANNYYEYKSIDLLNGALYSEGRDGWKFFEVPFVGTSLWLKSMVGSPSLGDINYIEFKADTWGGGFVVWTDGIYFDDDMIDLGTGLTGEYYDNSDFTSFKLRRTDGTVDFNWGGGSPDPSIGVETFSVRWTGTVKPQYSEAYTFYTTTDDGLRLWVNNQLLIDQWVVQGPTEWSGTISLTANQRYDIRMEYFEDIGGAEAHLSWSSASQAKQIVPQSRLYPASMLSFFDNFSDGNANGWTTYGGTWAVESGQYSVALGDGHKSMADNTEFGNLVYEADVNVITSSTSANGGVIFRVSNPSVGYDAYLGYYAGLKPGEDAVILGKADGSNWTEITRTSMTLNANTSYHMKVVAVGSSIKVYVTDMATPKINATDATYSSGAIGARTWAAHTHFDNIKVHVPLFYDGFESNNFTAGGWTNSGCTLGSTYKYAGTYAAIFNSSDSLTKAQSTAGYQNIKVYYARYTRQMETDDHFIAEWYNGSSWTTLEDVTGNSSWTEKVWSLPTGANNNASFQLRFKTVHNGSSDYAHLDEVRIVGETY